MFHKSKITKLLDLKEDRLQCYTLHIRRVTLWSPCRWNFRSFFWQSFAWFVV